jgi:hypothetical protein
MERNQQHHGEAGEIDHDARQIEHEEAGLAEERWPDDRIGMPSLVHEECPEGNRGADDETGREQGTMGHFRPCRGEQERRKPCNEE